jgi:TetR/AcrR family transcriptional regulator, regulator of autoinduction and epiphytic fitness
VTRKRRYDSPRRRAQAAATRQRVLDEAERLFVAQGYAATTLAEIASAASVSLPTVTSTFGTKLALLNSLIATTVRGDDTPVPLSEREWWRVALAEGDPVALIERYAANVRRIHERTTDIFVIVRGAATADPEIAAVQRELAEGRLGDSYQVAATLAGNGTLKVDLEIERAGDTIWALVSADLYRMLAVERAWQPEDYQHWLGEALISALLA